MWIKSIEMWLCEKCEKRFLLLDAMLNLALDALNLALDALDLAQ